MCSVYSTASVPDGRESVCGSSQLDRLTCWENWGLAFKGSTFELHRVLADGRRRY